MASWQGVMASTVILVLFACGATAQGCICTMEYMPVCAKGRTYSNSCQARCAGAQQQDIKPGACSATSSAAVVLPSSASPRPSPGLSARPTSPGLSARPTSPGLSFRPTSPGLSFRPTSPGLSARPTSPGLSARPTSPGLSARPTSPGLSARPNPSPTLTTSPIFTRTKPAKDHLVVVSGGTPGYIDLIALKAANPGKCCINLGAQTVKSIVSAASYYVSPPNDKQCTMKTCPSNPAGLPVQAVYVCGCKGGACCAKYP